MSSEFLINLEKYAEVIVKVGLNLQPGQNLLIGGPTLFNQGTPLEFAPLIRLITKKAYENGARFVEVIWDDETLKLSRFQSAPRDSFKEYPKWKADVAEEYAERGDAILYITSFDPDLLAGQDTDLINQFYQSHLKYNKKHNEFRRTGAMNWTAISGPSDGWTKKLYPQYSLEDAKLKFWDAIFEMNRIKSLNPVNDWKDHINRLLKTCEYLNEKHYDSVKFTAPGTTLTIGLAEGYYWRGGILNTNTGINFTPNMPTEEVFTIPHREKTEGFVTATKPLPGEFTIEDFTLEFSKGKVIKATAKKGEDHLKKNVLDIDDGTRYIGEVALVPHSSPISQSNMLYYNVLIDENASCHIALGMGLRFCAKGGETMTDEQFQAIGGNISGDHIDFMIGSDKLHVLGVFSNGESELIMKNGEWAFNLD